MSFDPSKRARFGVSKVKTGCLTCKARHIKCDEARPKCLRCVKSRRECRREQPDARGLNIIHYGCPVSRSIPQWSNLDLQERQLFHSFRTWTGPELAGVYNTDLWLRYIVQIAVSEPAIKHAILGVTALHKQIRDGQSLALPNDGMSYPLQHYTRAISLLVKSMEKDTMAFSGTPLIACILFCAFESMSFHLDSALSHAGSGVKMLNEQQPRPTQNLPTAIPTALLSALFCRLDTQGLELGETSLYRHKQGEGIRYMNGQVLTSVDEAQTSLDSLINAILHAIYDVDRDNTAFPQRHHQGATRAIDTLQNLIDIFGRWCRSFDEFALREAGIDNLAPLLLLQIWRVLLMINLKVDLRAGEMDFDRFVDEFDQITNLSHAFLFADNGLTADATLELYKLHDKTAIRTHTVHRSACSGDEMRGGYLGIHSDCTPIASDGQLDSHTLRETSAHLLQKAQDKQKQPCEQVKCSNTSGGQLNQHPTYCFSPGIVSPLYVTISRCREPGIRRRALALMQACKRREGLWDSSLAARLGIRVIEIEEQRAQELSGLNFQASLALSDAGSIISSSQIPNGARVRMIKPTFLPGRKSIERYYLGWPTNSNEVDRIDEMWIEEIMEW